MQSSLHAVYINSRHVQLDNSGVDSRPNDQVVSSGSRGVARREDGMADGYSHPTNRRTEGRQNTATSATVGREGTEAWEVATSVHLALSDRVQTVARREDGAADGFSHPTKMRRVGPSEDAASDVIFGVTADTPWKSQLSGRKGFHETNQRPCTNFFLDEGEQLLKRCLIRCVRRWRIYYRRKEYTRIYLRA